MTTLEMIITDRDAFVKKMGDAINHPDVVAVLNRDVDELIADAVAYYFAANYGVRPTQRKIATYGAMTKSLVPKSMEEISNLLKLRC